MKCSFVYCHKNGVCVGVIFLKVTIDITLINGKVFGQYIIMCIV